MTFLSSISFICCWWCSNQIIELVISNTTYIKIKKSGTFRFKEGVAVKQHPNNRQEKKFIKLNDNKTYKTIYQNKNFHIWNKFTPFSKTKNTKISINQKTFQIHNRIKLSKDPNNLEKSLNQNGANKALKKVPLFETT